MTLKRRSFLAVAGAAAGTSVRVGQGAATPWHMRCQRWGQTTSTDRKSAYDIAWWREQWKRTALDGVIVDAGNLDLFAEVAAAAHNDGLAVLAGLDSSRAGEDVLKAHPEWFARTQSGDPIKSGDGYAPCVHSSYREEYLSNIYRQIISRAHPEGFAENGWAGLGRGTICHCENCAKRFRDQTGQSLPANVDWSDRTYRDWIRWGYARRGEIWGTSNAATKAAGGPDCLWIGANAASRTLQSASLRDTHAIGQQTPFLLIDNPSRYDGGSFRQNAVEGRYLRGLAGRNATVLEIMAMYQQGGGRFRKTSNPTAEARLWMLSGIAGGITPCFRHIETSSDDRRQYEIAPPVFQWHKKNERYLVNRTPVATVGLVWSQSSMDFYGRDAASMLAELPYQGMARAIGASHVPFVSVHIADIEREADSLAVLVLPNVGAMSEQECAAVRRFVERGGTLIATGVTSLYDRDGEPQKDFGLADVFGAHINGSAPDRMLFITATTPSFTGAPRGHRGPGPGTLYIPGPYSGPAIAHTYLRLLPELAATTSGPHNSEEPQSSGKRHTVLAGFEETDIIPFGGFLTSLRVDQGREVLCTYVPPFPQTPTDEIWMRQPRTDMAALILGTYGKGKVAFLPADLDRRYGMDPLPDHGTLLRNLVLWAAGDRVDVTVDGPAMVGSYLYRQENRLILHLVSETGADNQRSLAGEISPVGPLKVKIKLPPGVKGGNLKLLVSEQRIRAHGTRSVEFEIARLMEHEVVVIE